MTTTASKSPRPLVSVERQFETDIATGRTEVRMFVKMYFDARDSGLLADMGDRRWRTLCCLATYMDKDGVCNPSQARIARDLGIRRQRVNERIQELLRYRFQNRPVIRLEAKRKATGHFASNVYEILPVAGFGIFGGPASVSGNPDMAVSGSTVTVKPDTNKIHVSNKNTHAVCAGEGDGERDLVSAFHARRGAPNTRPAPKELSQARSLIEEHGATTAAYIVEYAVAAAARTNFKVRHFGAVLSYTDEALFEITKREQKRIREEHKRRAERLEAERESYQRWKEAEVARIKEGLSAEALVKLRTAASEAILDQSQGKVPPGYETLLRIELMRFIAAQHAIPSFEEWRSGKGIAPESAPRHVARA